MSNKIDITLTDKQLKNIFKTIKEYNLKEDLASGNIKRIYKKLQDNSSSDLSLITQLLYSIDIDPLDYLDEVSINFLGWCNHKIEAFVIPDHIKRIGEDAFFLCKKLTSITIPDSVTSIGRSAFYNCSGLTSIVIPDSVIGIGFEAFSRCTGLTSITIPDSVMRLGYSAFHDCTGLVRVTIGSGVTNIGDYTFDTCSELTNIIIPDSVTKISTNAFGSCEKLKSIEYLGTMSDWREINIVPTAFPKNLKEIKCKDGVINL